MAAGAASSDRHGRAARTQSLYREVNERIQGLLRSWPVKRRGEEFVCECAVDTCTHPIVVPPDEYEQLRSHPTRFAVVPNEAHVFPEVERVVEEHEGYWVVEKVEYAAEVAEHFDPRSPASGDGLGLRGERYRRRRSERERFG